MREYFKVGERQEMLEHLYGSFDKAKVAGFAEHVCTAGRAGDPLCRAVAAAAGAELGEMIAALLDDTAPAAEPVTIAAVGSIWKSRDLFIERIVDALRPRRIRILLLTGSSAWGALVYGARRVGLPFAIDHSSHATVVFEGGGEGGQA
jgi:N-acetylglucosamine kinase-like BadF-type ATPase